MDTGACRLMLIQAWFGFVADKVANDFNMIEEYAQEGIDIINRMPPKEVKEWISEIVNGNLMLDKVSIDGVWRPCLRA
jgi:hypothetical protein